MRHAIELVGVAKEYHSHGDVVAAVDGIDLAIAEGEFFSLLGPSGCGKTTTLRLVAGFEEPTRGSVYLHGVDVTALAPNHRDVNMVFQSYALFAHLSVFDNVAFGLRRKGVPAAEVATRVGAMLELVDLAGRDRRKPAALSGGQQQRVALARALVNRPRALLLDEPLGALDLKLRQAMQVELKRIQRDTGVTFVYVTHDQGEALAMSDRIAVLNDGRIEQLGTPREIYEYPANKFVAGFIGTSNVVCAPVTDIDDGRALLALGPGERIVVPLRRRQAQVGLPVEVSVRPEKIDLTSVAPARRDGSVVRGVVTEVVYLGTSTNYTVRISTGAEVVVFDQNASSPEDLARRGDEVYLSWQAEHSYPIGDR